MIEKLVLVGPAYPLRGGIAHFNESFAISLQQKDVDVTLASFYLQYPGLLFPGKTQKTNSPPVFSLDIKNWISSINPISWVKTARSIQELKPDLVVIRYWHPFMAPSLGSIARRLKKKGIKIIALVDNAIPHEPSFYDNWFLKYFAKGVDAYFTLSKSVASDLNKIDPDKPVETSPHPIYEVFGQKFEKSSAKKELDLKQTDKIILFFGFVRKYKGLDLLIAALGKHLSSRPDIKLLVAGEFYEDKQKYLALISKFNLEDRVIIHDDYIPEEKVRVYFGASDIVAQTYRTATQSGVTQIAYNFDKPMLVTNVGGLSEIVDHERNGFVVEKSPEAIAKAISRYFDNDLESEFSREVSRQKERFSWSFFTNKFLSFAETL